MRASSFSALIAGVFCAVSGAALHAEAAFIGAFEWTRPEPYFGGVSGFDFLEEGTSFAAVGDDGQTMVGRFEREGAAISGVVSPWIGGLRDTLGNRVDGAASDAEGLAVMPDGAWLVSFEGVHRVVGYADREARARPFPVFPMMLGLPENRSLEALAVDGEGRIYAVAEGRFRPAPGFPVFRFADGGWSLFDTLPEVGAYRPVGADFGPDGRFYLLTRRLALPFRFASRVTRYRVTADGLTEPEVVLDTPLGTHDNLEGLAVWHDGAGLRLTMVSDNNHNTFQRTEFVEYRVAE